VIINWLNAGLPAALPRVRPAADDGQVVWYDVAPDGFVTPRDALIVINHLNRRGLGEGEAAWDGGSSTAASGVPIADPIGSGVTRSLEWGPQTLTRPLTYGTVTRDTFSELGLPPVISAWPANGDQRTGLPDRIARARDEVGSAQRRIRELDWLEEILSDLAADTPRDS
jgi:hypothetical protein